MSQGCYLLSSLDSPKLGIRYYLGEFSSKFLSQSDIIVIYDYDVTVYDVTDMLQIVINSASVKV